MSKPFLVLHPSMKAEVERVLALNECTDPMDQQARLILNCVDVLYEGEVVRVDRFQVIKTPKANLFRSPPDASIRKLMKALHDARRSA